MKAWREEVEISGTVIGVFAHRFLIQGVERKWLANIGRRSKSHVDLQDGDKVFVKGELRHSEIRVSEMQRDLGRLIHKSNEKAHSHHKDHSYRDPREAVAVVEQLGFQVVGDPRRKPKHFVILGRSRTRAMRKFKVNFDGEVRGQKVADHDDQKPSAAPLER
jgi:hypothetical protein